MSDTGEPRQQEAGATGPVPAAGGPDARVQPLDDDRDR